MCALYVYCVQVCVCVLCCCVCCVMCVVCVHVCACVACVCVVLCLYVHGFIARGALCQHIPSHMVFVTQHLL